jgi:hypothetical protein
MKNVIILSLIMVALAFVALFPLAVICVIMWIWDINAYIIAIKIVATLYVLLVVYIIMDRRAIIDRVYDKYGEYRANKGA